MSFGIALGGGGAKGLAHIGILEVLDEHAIKPEYVAGTSIGAIVGALYCLQGRAEGLKLRARAMIASEEFKNLELDKFYTSEKNIFERFRHELFEKFYLGSLLFRRSHTKYDATRKIFQDMFDGSSFDDCRIGFSCNALDIQSGEEVVFTRGSLADAVWASCAIPGIFPPYVQAQRLFVDGGVIDNIPIEPLLNMGTGTVLAVYLNQRPKFQGEPNTGFQINQRAYLFMKYHLDRRIISKADLVVMPDVHDFHWADFNSLEELVQRGRRAALENIDAIRSLRGFRYKVKKTLKKYFFV